MARIRTIKPEFWTDETLVDLPFEYRLLFIGLWNFVDDEGFIEYRTKQIKMKVFPGDEVNVPAGIQALKKRSLIEVHDLVLDGQTVKVLRVANFKRHQVINRPGKSRYFDAYQALHAQTPSFSESSVSDHGGLTRERKGKEGKGRELGQVGGGGHLSSDDADPTAPDFEPWRCDQHQGQDVKCWNCAEAKKNYRARQDAERKAAKGSQAARDRQLALDAQEKRRIEDERTRAEAEAQPDAIKRAKAQAFASIKTAPTN